MAETLTANYSWTKPDPGASANTWGATLNADLDKIDAQVFSNQQAGVPVGSGAVWFAATPPTNWLICDGSSLATTGTYAALFAVIGTTFNQAGDAAGTFRLPNIQGVFPLGAGPSNALASTGGAASVTLTQAQLPAHTHSVSATQTPHTHTGSSTPHSHTITDPGHYHQTNIVFGGGSDIASGSGWGQHNVSTAAAVTGITGDNPATVSVAIAAASANITVNPNTGSVGGGAATPIIPPYIAINFIIKFQ